MVLCTAAAGDVHTVFNQARLKLTRWTDRGRMKKNNPCLQASYIRPGTFSPRGRIESAAKPIGVV